MNLERTPEYLNVSLTINNQADKTAASCVATRAGHQYLEQQSFYSVISRDHHVLAKPSIVGNSWR